MLCGDGRQRLGAQPVEQLRGRLVLRPGRGLDLDRGDARVLQRGADERQHREVGHRLRDALGLGEGTDDLAEPRDVAVLGELHGHDERPVGAGPEPLGGQVVGDPRDAPRRGPRVVGEAQPQPERRGGQQEHGRERHDRGDDRAPLQQAGVVRPPLALGVVRVLGATVAGDRVEPRADADHEGHDREDDEQRLGSGSPPAGRSRRRTARRRRRRRGPVRDGRSDRARRRGRRTARPGSPRGHRAARAAPAAARRRRA